MNSYNQDMLIIKISLNLITFDVKTQKQNVKNKRYHIIFIIYKC